HVLLIRRYTATTEIYTLSLHDALPIYCAQMWASAASKVPISGQAAHTGVYPRRLFRETGGGNGEPAAGKKAGKPGPVAPAGSKEDGKCRKLLLLSVLRLR